MLICALRPRGEPLLRGDLAALARASAETPVRMLVDGPFGALAAGRVTGRSGLARWRGLTAAGDVRLDNASELADIAGIDAARTQNGLELVLAAIDRAGESCLARILGDYAFVVWDAHAHKLIAARDAFGIKPLYYDTMGDTLVFASDATPLIRDSAVDDEFVAAFLSGTPGAADRTIWRGIRSVPPGTWIRQRGTVRSTTTFWRAEDFVPAAHSDEATDCEQFRSLLTTAVRSCMGQDEHVWAQLSGGLDSSAVVALAAAERATGLGGTITVVDSLGDGDERRYSDEVVRRYGVRNEQVRDCWAWQDDGEPPPLTDRPAAMYPFYARERKIGQIVRANGAAALLTGAGADHYLYGTLDYITDMASEGRISVALSELTTWAVTTRQSFWGLGRRYLIEPFLPRLHSPHAAAPAWLDPRLHDCSAARPRPQPGSRFARSIAGALRELPAWLDACAFGPDIELRHPFLYRPLVEWSLRLPPRQRIRPGGRKWILREALRGVLPETVRTRATKGGIDARILWSLQHERSRVDALLRDPILAQLGCIDAARLRHDVEQARRGVPVNNVQLFSTLSLETWLAVRAGQWHELQTPRAA